MTPTLKDDLESLQRLAKCTPVINDDVVMLLGKKDEKVFDFTVLTETWK